MDMNERPLPLLYCQRHGAKIPAMECLDPMQRVSPAKFERWMAAMWSGGPGTDDVPYPDVWQLRFPFKRDPEHP